MRHSLRLLFAALLACLFAHAAQGFAQPVAGSSSGTSPAERRLAEASQQGRFAFLVFYRQQNAVTDTMVQTLKQKLANRTDTASIVYVRIGDPAEQVLVKKYGVARAPMPMTVALAPNGAMTAIHPRRIDDAKFDDAFVTPASAESLKALQEQKIVFVSVRNANHTSEPNALTAFANDPHFRERMGVVSVDANDVGEQEFLEGLQVDASAPSQLALVVLAPPGVVVGKFSASATKDEIAAAIAKAGKCCDDPNCKHNKRK